MSRIAVFTSKGCNYCTRAKQLLKDRGIAYTEIDVAAKAKGNQGKTVLSAVTKFTGRRTVPQIFIAETCIGGADELSTLSDTGELLELVQDAETQGRRTLPSALEDLLPSPGDRRETRPASVDVNWTRYDELMGAAESLKQSGGSGVRKGMHAGWSGKAILDALCQARGLNRNAAEGMGQELLDNRILVEDPRDVYYVGAFRDDERAVYCLPPTLGQNVLNGQMLWPLPVRSASQVAESLRLKILDLYEKFLSPDGKAVDYKGLGESREFADYVRCTSELRDVDIGPLSREEKMAFFINIYNAMIIHATAAVGTPSNIIERLMFFGNVKYCINRQIYSCNDIEHGILRDNACNPSSLLGLVRLGMFAKTFSGSDPRRAFVVSPVDPRIHFALVCGAKSCPPIRLYSSENLEEGLAGAAEAFCETEVRVDGPAKTVTLSKIFQWYGKDFASNEVDLLRKIVKYAPNPALETLLAEKNPRGIKVRYAAYNWDVNSK
mmetsp:Transcript_12493/g.31728  ORF Transcript_12493/g.31728 Transcript_12493/m.31728 type:complete len:494 (-) Transcript_12493:108-1589(-)